MCLGYLNNHFTSWHFTSFITISHHLELKVKIQNYPNKQITTTTESSVPWSDLNFPKVCSKTLLDISTLPAVLLSYTLLCVAYSKLCGGKLFNRKRKPHTMPEERHKINKFANYRHVFISSQNPLIYSFWRYVHHQYTNPLVRFLLPLCKLWEHRLDFIEENVWEVVPLTSVCSL